MEESAALMNGSGESGVGGVRNIAGGRYENRVAAWFAVRILANARAAARWGLPSAATLIAVHLQTADDLDDLRITASDSTTMAIQVKRSLTVDTREGGDFAKTLRQIVAFCRKDKGGPDVARAVVIVGPGASETIRRHLLAVVGKVRALTTGQTLADLILTKGERSALDRLTTVLAREWPEAGEPEHRALLARVWLTVLDVDPEGNDDIAAREMLRRDVLLDPGQGELAWAALLARCTDAAILRAGVDRDSLRDHLAAVGVALRPDYPDGPFIAPAAFFRPLLDATRPFHHAWDLVGRAQVLAELSTFVDAPDRRVALLIARGGAGKSRLLRAVAENCAARHPDRRFLLAREGVTPGPDAARYLPDAPWVLAVDDAHRRQSETATFLALLREGEGQGRAILALRPHAEEAMRARLAEAGIDPRAIVTVRLDDLDREELRALAAQALGPTARPEWVARLAHLGRDSPLVILVAGRLLASRRVPLGLLEREADFRSEVLDRFADVILGQVSAHIPAERCRDLLKLVAALGPDQLDAGPLAEAAASFLGWTLDAYLEALGHLEEAGVLLRRGRLLRIAPDVLADHLLHRACVTGQGRPTRYVERLFAHFQQSGLVTMRLLTNLAELDWRQRRADDAPPDLLRAVWQALRADFAAAGYLRRATLLDQLRPLAGLQPGPMLELVELALSDPVAGDDLPFARDFAINQDNVIRKLPPILGDIAHDPNLFSCCCDLLWSLGRDDERTLPQHPDHALRVLEDLATYSSHKPLWVCEGVLDAVERWLRDPAAHDHAHTPLILLGKLLAKVGEDTWSDRRSFSWSGFTLDPAQVGPLRRRALALAEGQLAHAVPAIERQTLDLLLGALDDPHPIGAADVSDADRLAWRDEQLTILDRLAQVIAEGPEQHAHLHIAERLIWHAQHSRSAEVRERAASVIAGIPDTPRWRTTRALSPYSRLDAMEGGDDWLGHGDAMREAAARELVAAFPAAADGLDHLDERLGALDAWRGNGSAGTFMWQLARVHSGYAAELVALILDAPARPTARCLPQLLSPLRAHDAARAAALARRAVETGTPAQVAAVAIAYREWAADPTPEDISTLGALVIHPGRVVRYHAIAALAALNHRLPDAAIELALQLEIGDDPALAEEFFLHINPELGLNMDVMTDAQLVQLLSRLRPLSVLDGHWAGRFLERASHRLPEAVVSLLLDRVAQDGGEGYRPLPYVYSFGLPGVAACSRYADLLRRIRDAMLPASDGGDYGEPSRWADLVLPDLYRVASQGYDATGLAVLEEWFDDPQRLLAAGRLLKEVPPSFVFVNSDFVIRFVRAAVTMGQEVSAEATGPLYFSTAFCNKQGTPGQPFPEDVSLFNQATERLAQLPVGTPEYRFYARLRDAAAAAIGSAKQEAEEMEE